MLATKQPQNVFQAVTPGKGGQIEVLIAWHERILQSCHYPVGPKVTIGSKANINLPLGTMVRNFNLLESRNGQAFVNLPFETKNFIQKDTVKTEITESNHRLQQNEVLFISFGNNIHLAVRFAPLTERIKLSSPLLFSSSEYTTMLSALILTTLSGLIVSVLSPKVKKEEEFSERIVEVRFEKPLIQIENSPVPEPVQPTVKMQETIEPQKLDKIISIPQKPKKNLVVKKTSQDSAHSKNQVVAPAQLGLMAVLSTDGIKKKMDQAYSGTGDLIEIGETALGSSSSNENNSRSDLGSKLKNTGEGGARTATVGITNVKINRNGLGNEALGGGQEFGQKEQIGIVVGGGEENFIGSIDKEAVRRAVRSHLPAIKNCYDREYKKNSNLEGKIVVAWEIHKNGLAQKARVVSAQSTMSNHFVESCLRTVIESIQFPEAPKGSVVEVTGFPFVFSGAK